jgi:hypothetical protein
MDLTSVTVLSCWFWNTGYIRGAPSFFVCLYVGRYFWNKKKITGLSWVFRHLWCLFCNLCCLNVPVKMMNRIFPLELICWDWNFFGVVLLKNCTAHWNKIACLHVSPSWSIIIAKILIFQFKWLICCFICCIVNVIVFNTNIFSIVQQFAEENARPCIFLF